MAEAGRIRKAWFVYVQGCETDKLVFAPDAGRARATVIDGVRDAWGLTFREALQAVRWVRRAPERDMVLPSRHPLATQLDPRILHCVVHAFGGTGERAGYRDHFYADAETWELKAGLYHGLFAVVRRDNRRDGRPDMIMYALTTLGRSVAQGEVETYPRF